MDPGGIIDGLRDLAFDEFAKPLTQPMDCYLEGAFAQAQPRGCLSLRERG